MTDSNCNMRCNARWCWVWSLSLLLTVSGCQTYGPVSDTAYDYSMALYSVTNRKAEEKLSDVTSQIEASKKAGEITAKEAQWLQEIVDDARAGDWEKANQASRQMMQEQVQ